MSPSTARQTCPHTENTQVRSSKEIEQCVHTYNNQHQLSVVVSGDPQRWKALPNPADDQPKLAPH